MSSTPVTLASIRAAAEAKYGSFPIELDGGEIVTLLNPLRLPKEQRKALLTLQDEVDGEDRDQEDVVVDMLRLVAASPAQADKLVKAADGDLTILVSIFEQYSERAQVGEASASQS